MVLSKLSTKQSKFIKSNYNNAKVPNSISQYGNSLNRRLSNISNSQDSCISHVLLLVFRHLIVGTEILICEE